MSSEPRCLGKRHGGRPSAFFVREAFTIPVQVIEDTLMNETMVHAEVTYTLEHAGNFYVIEHVPVRVCKETGEQLFFHETVEHIQALIKSNSKPDRVIQTPLYEYTPRPLQETQTPFRV